MQLSDLGEFQKTQQLPESFINSTPDLATIIINRECNLYCQHCDWPPKHAVNEPYFSSEEWKKFLTDFAELGNREEKTIVISGREPLYDKASRGKVVTLINDSKEIGLYAGFITNGINILWLFDEYPGFNPEFMDISFEGPEKIHDQTRGAGSFAKAFSGLEIALDKVENLFISVTITEMNIKIIPEFVQTMAKKGARKFVFHSLVPGEFVTPGLRAKDTDFLGLIQTVTQMAERDEASYKQIIFDLYPASFDDFPRIIAQINTKKLFVDNYVATPLSNNVFIRFVNLLESYAISFLVSPEGYSVTPLEMRTVDYLKDKNDAKRIGNILKKRTNPFESEIVAMANNISPICFDQECFKFCLGQNSFCPITKIRGEDNEKK